MGSQGMLLEGLKLSSSGSPCYMESCVDFWRIYDIVTITGDICKTLNSRPSRLNTRLGGERLP